jgi:hypothetical protein
MSRRGKLLRVDADFRHDILGGLDINARNRRQPQVARHVISMFFDGWSSDKVTVLCFSYTRQNDRTGQAKSLGAAGEKRGSAAGWAVGRRGRKRLPG